MAPGRADPGDADPRLDRALSEPPARGESRLPATLAILAGITLYATLPEHFTLGPSWLLPGLEAALLIPLSIAVPRREADEPMWHRALAITLIAIVNIANLASLILLVGSIIRGEAVGSSLLFASIQIWLTNVIVFALWYWEIDRGGPSARRVLPSSSATAADAPDFLFPQMTAPQFAPGWSPHFVDYLYVAFTNATAFSPTDTMPLSITAKVLMLIQSLASLLTIALVAARAINILQ